MQCSQYAIQKCCIDFQNIQQIKTNRNKRGCWIKHSVCSIPQKTIFIVIIRDSKIFQTKMKISLKDCKCRMELIAKNKWKYILNKRKRIKRINIKRE